MVAPRAVRQAAEKADEILKEAGKTKPVEGKAPEGSTDVIDPEKKEAVVEDPKPKDPEVKDPDIITEPDYKQQYLVLRGKYNAEVPALNVKVKELQDEIARLNEKPEPKEDPAEKSLLDSMPQELKDIMGDYKEPSKLWEWMLMQMDSMRQQPGDDNTEKRLSELENTVKSSTQTGGQETSPYEKELTSLVPDWRVLNKNEDFIVWLDIYEPLYKKTRNDLLIDAHNDQNAELVAYYFNAWKAEQNGAHVDTSNNNANTGLDIKEQPGQNRGGDPTDNKPRYAKSEIKQFFEDVKRGKYKGKEEERRRKDREYFDAQMEGRVY